MKIFGLSIVELIALVGFVWSIIYGLMKYYDLFMDLKRVVNQLNKTISTFENRFDGHENRLTRLEEQTKTLFNKFKE